MKLLVTGGTGYIGRFCVRQVVQAGHEVVVLDRRPLPAADRRPGTDVVVGDIADQGLLDRLFAEHDVDAVLHLAAEKSVGDSMSDPGAHLLNNVCGSLVLFEAMRRAGVRKIVFSSSAAVYGTPAQLPLAEDAPTVPDNAYGAGKLMAEQILHWYRLAHQFDVVSLRYFNAAGAADDGSLGESGHADNLVPRVMDALSGRAGPVPIFGTDFPTPDGTAIRDYIHVEDLAEAHLRALELVRRDSGEWVFNLGTGRGNSVREVIKAAERASGRAVPSYEAPRRGGDPAASWADASAAARELGWRATRDLEQIVTSAWRWEESRSE